MIVVAILAYLGDLASLIAAVVDHAHLVAHLCTAMTLLSCGVMLQTTWLRRRREEREEDAARARAASGLRDDPNWRPPAGPRLEDDPNWRRG